MCTSLVISIVSHQQINLVAELINSIIPKLNNKNSKIVLTVNTPEDLTPISEHLDKVTILENVNPKGFGANHNHAFDTFNSDVFLVLNPDILFEEFDFEYYINLASTTNVGIVSCTVVNSFHNLEDNIRDDINLSQLFIRHVMGVKQKTIPHSMEPIKIAWCAGMIMFFNSKAYKKVGGFDERYYMYLEDADICRRMRILNYEVLYASRSYVIHAARRASRKLNKFLFIHLCSMVKYLFRFGF